MGNPVEILRSFGGWRGRRFAPSANAHLSDDETVAKMGHPDLWLGLDLGHRPRGLWGWALFYADDLALELFVLLGFDLCLVLVDLVVDLAADDELGGVDRFFGIGPAGVAVAFGVEG